MNIHQAGTLVVAVVEAEEEAEEEAAVVVAEADEVRVARYYSVPCSVAWAVVAAAALAVAADSAAVAAALAAAVLPVAGSRHVNSMGPAMQARPFRSERQEPHQ